MTQAVVIYQRHNRLIVTPESQTVDGFWVAHAPVTTMNQDTDQHKIGQAVIEALDVSRQEIPNPARSARPFTPVLKAAGVTSFSSFMEDAAAVRITRTESEIEITPMQNSGPEIGFEFLEDRVARSDFSPESLAQALGRFLGGFR